MGNSDETPSRSIAEGIDESGLGPAALASIGSVGLALYYYYVRGEEQRGQFVGLWPMTILGMAMYLKLGQIREQLRETNE